MISYSDYCNSHPTDTYYKSYRDCLYGPPHHKDNLLLELLILEIDQAELT